MTNSGEATGVAERIRETLNTSGLTINRLSDLAGIPYPTLRRRLKFHPEFFTVDELARIAEATGADFAYLAAGAPAVAA